MKNKKVTYFLLLAVLLVWGLIFYRAYESVSGDTNDLPNRQRTVPAPDPYTQILDTFTLLANYRDPFLGLMPEAKTGNRKQEPRIAAEKSTPTDWSFISYKGTIHNRKQRKRIAIFSIHGKEVLIPEGGSSEGITFLKNYPDSVKIAFEGKKTILRKSN